MTKQELTAARAFPKKTHAFACMFDKDRSPPAPMYSGSGPRTPRRGVPTIWLRVSARLNILALVLWLVLLPSRTASAFTFNVSSSNVSVLAGGGLPGIITGATLQATFHGNLSFNAGTRWVEGWTGTNDYISWNVASAKADSYDVAIIYHSTPDEAGSEFEVAAGSSSVVGTVYDTASLYPGESMDFERMPLEGTLSLPAGNSSITLRATTATGVGEVMKFFSLELTPLSAKDSIIAASETGIAHRASTEWFVAANYGIVLHWEASTMPPPGGDDKSLGTVFQTTVSNFNVEAFANMAQETGAGYVIFHNAAGGYSYPAPITNWSRLYGATSITKRDLIGDIADALKQRGIKFIPGFTFDFPGNVWWGAAGLPDRWTNTMSEISQRYGKRVAGYYFNGGWFELYPYNAWMTNYPYAGPWQKMSEACKKGNADRIIGYNFYVYPQGTEWSEFWAGESAQDLGNPLSTRIIEAGPGKGLQSHVMFQIDDNYLWTHNVTTEIGPPLYSTDTLVNYIKACNANGGAVTLNVGIYRDGTVSAATLDQLKSIRQTMTSVNNAGGATNITGTAAQLRGTLVSTGGLPTSVWVYWGENDCTNDKSAWAHADSFGPFEGDVPFMYSTNITGLVPGTTYYYRFYAINDAGEVWALPSDGFTTTTSGGGSPPVVNNDGGATGITFNTAWLNGTITSTGSSATAVYAFWGASDGTNNRSAWAYTNYFGTHTGAVPRTYSTSATGLSSAATYFYRFYATNSAGGAWAGSSERFMTSGPHSVPENWLQTKGLTNYADFAAAENDDPDYDGMKTWQEYYAGTDPTNAASLFAVKIVYSNGNILVIFPAVLTSGTGYFGLTRYYDLQGSSNFAGGTWEAVSTNIPGNGGNFVHTNVSGDSCMFYRTNARLK